MLAGCETLSEIALKFSPETALARLCEWERFVDQSTLSRTPDQLRPKQIDQLNQVTTQTWRSFSQTHRLNWQGFLRLDFDLSGLPSSAKGEASQEGFFSDKKAIGRQLSRVSAVKYQETVWSDVFLGNYHSIYGLQPAVQAAENTLELAPHQRQRTVWRTGGGSLLIGRLKDGALQYSYFISILSFPSKGHFLTCYDYRGAVEVEQFRSDNDG